MRALDLKSGVVVVDAAEKLERLDQDLRLKDLTLGPLSPRMRRLDVAEWVEGPYAGLRAVPGGRLEPLCLALTAVMPDGLRFVSLPSPRSAAGPDLDALFFGGEGRFGKLVTATLRLFPRPRAERQAGFVFSKAKDLVAALRAAVGGGCFLRRAAVASRDGRFILGAELAGTPEAVERDLVTLGREVFARGGRSTAQVQGQAPEGGGDLEEREATWEEIKAALGAGGRGSLYRLSLETVIAAGLGEVGVPLLGSGGWSNAPELEAVLREVHRSGPAGGVS